MLAGQDPICCPLHISTLSDTDPSDSDSLKMVEKTGNDPATSALLMRRSPN